MIRVEFPFLPPSDSSAGTITECRTHGLLASRAFWIGGAISLALWSGAIGFALGLLKGGA